MPSSRPGTPRAPRVSRRLRASDGRVRAAPPPRPRAGGRAPSASAFTFISPNPGSAWIRFFRSSVPPASRQTRSASPPYSSATTAQSSCTRLAMLPGKRWIAGRSRKSCSSRSGSVPAISAASSRPSRCFSLSGPRERRRDGDLLVEHEPDQERERLRGEELVRLAVAGEVERVRHASILATRVARRR